MAPRNTSTTWETQLNCPEIGTNPLHCPKGKAILPKLSWGLHIFLSQKFHTLVPRLCFTHCYSLVSLCHQILLPSRAGVHCPGDLSLLLQATRCFSWILISFKQDDQCPCVIPPTNNTSLKGRHYVIHPCMLLQVHFSRFFTFFSIYISFWGHLLIHSIHSVNIECLLLARHFFQFW